MTSQQDVLDLQAGKITMAEYMDRSMSESFQKQIKDCNKLNIINLFDYPGKGNSIVITVTDKEMINHLGQNQYIFLDGTIGHFEWIDKEKSAVIFVPDNKPTPTDKMETQEFIKLTKKAKSPKELAVLYCKKDYSKELSESEKKLKELEKELNHYQSLNVIQAEEKMKRENILEKKRCATKNAEVQKEVDRLTGYYEGINPSALPQYEKDSKAVLGEVKSHLKASINTLEHEKKSPDIIDDVFSWLADQIEDTERAIKNQKIILNTLLKDIECNQHLVEIIRRAL